MGGTLGAGGEPKVGHTIHRNRDRIVVFNKAQKQPVNMLSQDSRWQQLSHAALLVPPS